MKRVFLAAMLAAGVLFASPTSAGAWATFCDWDPVVPVITPAGHVVLVYDSVWTESPLDLGLPLATYAVSRVYTARGGAETAVDMTISVPTGLLFRYATIDEVTSGLLGSGTVYARESGHSGAPVHLKFILHTP
ncbi:MAG TPA: hypothetical protein VLK30_03915 [Candidatus Limnocylindrales bacterium]|nr:hypothetical protein [Candidatus Limnocylindrales bacterium]